MLTFEQPLLLLLLLPIGTLVFLAWQRMSLPFPKAQRYMILACRLALFTLVISALAGAALALPVSRQAVVFVGDRRTGRRHNRTCPGTCHWGSGASR